MSPAKPLLLLLALSAPVHADSVKGFCERDGKRLSFTDGIAFADARDAEGVITTAVYLTAKPLDRSDLAKCSECAGPLPEEPYGSPRGTRIEKQRAATAAGWMEIAHSGIEGGMSSIVNVMYLADDGVLTGIDGGNGRVELALSDGKRAVGKVFTEARGPGFDETDMTCEITFDLAVGWPGAR